MNVKTWIAFGMGAVVALGLGFAALNFVGTASADAGIGNVTAAFVGEDVEHRGNRGGRGGDRIGGGSEFLAEALGITVEELEAAYETVRTEISESDDLDRGDVEELLAAELGITVEALDAAKDEAKSAAIAAAVADGTITQEQADLLEARQALKDAIDKKEITASVLGITVEELEAAREDGSSRSDLLDAAGLTAEEFATEMQAAYDAAVAQAVADGVITQEQADQLSESGFGGRGKGFGGRNGGNGRGQGQSGRGFNAPTIDGNDA